MTDVLFEDPDPMGDDDDSAAEGIAWIEPDHPVSMPAAVVSVTCWRCGKPVPAAYPTCPYCRAGLAASGPPTNDPRREVSRRPTVDHGEPVGKVLYLYFAFLITSVVYGCTIDFSITRKAPVTDQEVHANLMKMVVVEAIDAVLVLVGIAWARRPPALPRIEVGRRIAGWAMGALLLVVLLLANFSYFHLMKDVFGIPTVEQNELDNPKLLPWLILTMCVQPAIIEELFFRYLVLGHLRPVLGTHGAVLVSGVMFGLAHIFAPLGIPYLIVAGIGFGYARVFGRSLMVPILMHFVHNAVVLWAQS